MTLIVVGVVRCDNWFVGPFPGEITDVCTEETLQHCYESKVNQVFHGIISCLNIVNRRFSVVFTAAHLPAFFLHIYNLPVCAVKMVSAEWLYKTCIAEWSQKCYVFSQA